MMQQMSANDRDIVWQKSIMISALCSCQNVLVRNQMADRENKDDQ